MRDMAGVAGGAGNTRKGETETRHWEGAAGGVSWSGSENGNLNANSVSTYKDLSGDRFRQAFSLQRCHSIVPSRPIKGVLSNKMASEPNRGSLMQRKFFLPKYEENIQQSGGFLFAGPKSAPVLVMKKSSSSETCRVKDTGVHADSLWFRE